MVSSPGHEAVPWSTRHNSVGGAPHSRSLAYTLERRTRAGVQRPHPALIHVILTSFSAPPFMHEPANLFSDHSQASLWGSGRRFAFVAVAAVAAGLLAAGCGDPGSAAASPTPGTLGSASLEYDEIAQPDAYESTRLRAAERSEPLPVGQPVAPGTSVSALSDAFASAHGPTEDASAQIARFAPMPPLATPKGTEIVDIRADVRAAFEGRSALVTAETTLLVDGDIATIGQFYQDEADRLGWSPLTTRSIPGPEVATIVAYSVAGNAYPLDDVTIELHPVDAIGPANRPRTLVRIRAISVRNADAADMQAKYEQWLPDVTLPPGATITGVGVQSTAVGRHRLHLTYSAHYPGITAPQLASQVRAALIDANIAQLDVPRFGDALDSWVYADNELFDDWRFAVHDVDNPDTGLVVAAQLTIDARMAFTPGLVSSTPGEQAASPETSDRSDVEPPDPSTDTPDQLAPPVAG